MSFIELDEDDEQYSNDGAVCPYCGYLHEPPETDYTIYNESLDEYECDHCGKTFKMSLYISYSWTTSKKED